MTNDDKPKVVLLGERKGSDFAPQLKPMEERLEQYRKRLADLRAVNQQWFDGLITSAEAMLKIHELLSEAV